MTEQEERLEKAQGLLNGFRAAILAASKGNRFHLQAAEDFENEILSLVSGCPAESESSRLMECGHEQRFKTADGCVECRANGFELMLDAIYRVLDTPTYVIKMVDFKKWSPEALKTKGE